MTCKGPLTLKQPKYSCKHCYTQHCYIKHVLWTACLVILLYQISQQAVGSYLTENSLLDAESIYLYRNSMQISESIWKEDLVLKINIVMTLGPNTVCLSQSEMIWAWLDADLETTLRHNMPSKCFVVEPCSFLWSNIASKWLNYIISQLHKS